ncbi:phosphatidate cytidylyltransferase [Hyunsoonleella pacifica]|uniref:Phosphatidate cytidylyltransferase n=1 Tax=Hyunsoonleella pacifica TaxID=1080224 RepID=A0A4Q9FJZ5_9FLAO|nr:phosphatidate cytidylyltransferase [Hyunsoonleella pacifica]TBN13863.1 phosphatidate cytidylyltransferase [Hyunsoonleella pacifica]GGD26332.1 phosphatidate cytidylyltransferase [Hyunsoonleella pacifica]
MKDMLLRSLSGLLYVAVLIIALTLTTPHVFIILFFVFGILSLYEFNKLIQLNSIIPYFIFIILYLVFGYWKMVLNANTGLDEAIQILIVITIFVNLFLIKDLFSRKTIPLFVTKRFIITTFYLSSGFVFAVLTASVFSPKILLGCFILVWINDSFAYLVGKNFGRQKLFEKISPKKTVEGFLGGLFFACITSYFISSFTGTLNFTNWLMLSITVAVFGTLGDLIESKFKRQANVKDSGTIMPGHGGLLDRLDSIIFASPFIYLFLRILHYVS